MTSLDETHTNLSDLACQSLDLKPDIMDMNELYLIPILFLIVPALLYLLFYTTICPKGRNTNNLLPTNWPVIGMLPGITLNVHRAHDYITEVLIQCGGTYRVRAGVFTTVNMVLTCDPANIDHIFSKKFSNYPKGAEFRKIFEILGDGIFNAENELWELHRKTTISQIRNAKFYSFLETSVWQTVQTKLLPILDTICERGSHCDLQDILQRYTFDGICKLVLDYDPNSLSIDMPYIPCEEAFNNATGPLLLRHLVPESIWKLQKWLKIGPEKMLIESAKAVDDFLYPLVEKTMEGDDNILAGFTKVYTEMNKGSMNGLRKFLRDTALNLMLAGRDGTSICLTWLFYLIATNPSAETKILEEIESQLGVKKDDTWRFFDLKESHKLLYLHGALCESLRLFPPVPLEPKSPRHADTLPSGHNLHENEKVVVSFFSIGRMESVWGNDCLEFKPERWITDHGSIKHEPSYKFPAFNVGPRTCLGKEISFYQMKMVAAATIFHFKIRLVEGHPVCPDHSIVLQVLVKNGLRVHLFNREFEY